MIPWDFSATSRASHHWPTRGSTVRSSATSACSSSSSGWRAAAKRSRATVWRAASSQSACNARVAGSANAPSWSRETTGPSLEPYLTFNAISQASLVTPTPLLIVHGTTDAVLLPELAQAAHDAAGEPKELAWIDTHNHIELYDQDPYVSEAVGHVLRRLEQVLS